jgi:hypothetical protein
MKAAMNLDYQHGRNGGDGYQKTFDFPSVANMKMRSLILVDNILLSSPNDSSKLGTCNRH